MNFRSKISVVALALLLAALPAVAQFDRGTITGVVMDSSGAVLPKADLTLTNADTGVVTRVQSNDVGLYTFPNVTIGRYEVKVGAPAFKSVNRSGITLNVAQTVRLDFTLEPGSVRDSITVTAEASLLKVDTSLVSTTVQSAAIKDLPLSFAGGRSMEAFAYALTPAVEGNNWTSYIAGGAAFSKEVLIDGISATSQEQGHVGETSPPTEAVEEFSVQTSGMSAEYGHTSGGVFNFAMKSGSNKPHGSAFYYGRNEALNANTWMNNWNLSQSPGNSTYKRARDRQNLFGFSEGGPVFVPKIYDGRNKTFFFASYEKYKMSDYQLSQSYGNTVPIPDFLTGDFSRLLTGKIIGKDALGRDVMGGQIFDPSTLRQVGGKWVSDPFVGNIIPQTRFSNVSKKVVDIYKKSYQPMLANVLTNNSTNTAANNPWFNQNQFSVKIDHSFTDRNRLSGSYMQSARPRILADAGGVWDPSDPDGAGGPFAKARLQEVSGHQVHLNDNWTITPTLINTFSAAYNGMRNPSISKQDGKGWNKTLGLDSSTSATLFPQISFGGSVNGVGESPIGYNASGYYTAHTYTLNNSVNWFRGRHSVKAGVQVWRQQINSHGSTADPVSFSFSNQTTGIPGNPWSNQVGFGFASFLLGQVDSAGKGVPFDLYGRRDYFETFIQDDIKVTNKLTVNAGLRWEQPQAFHEKYGHWANFNRTITNTLYNQKGALEFLNSPSDSFERNKDWKEFSPRVGLAYRLSNKTVLRSGYGIFFTPIGINYWSGVPYGFAPGYQGTNTITASNNIARFNWDSGYPNHYVPPTKDPNALPWGVVAIDPNSLFQGYSQQYNFSFQYEIRPNLVVEATYMGNVGSRLHSGGLNRNQPTRAAYEGSTDPTAWIWDASSAAAAGVPYPYQGFSAYAGMALQPYPHVAAVTWGPIYDVGTNRGASRYDSLQLQVTKRTSKGLTGQFAYILSKTRGNITSNFDESWDSTLGIQDMYNADAEKNTVLGYDQRHIVKGYIQAELPFGKGHHMLGNSSRLVNALVGGWNVSMIFRYNTGNPLGAYTNVWYPGWDGAVYANWNKSVDLSRKFYGSMFNPAKQNAAQNLYFDPSAFSNPTGHMLGNGERLYDTLRGFGYANEDLGAIKYWHIGEGISLQFRAELLNAFNRHHFADPNTSLGNATTFGYVTGLTGTPRNVQFGLRMGW